MKTGKHVQDMQELVDALKKLKAIDSYLEATQKAMSLPCPSLAALYARMSARLAIDLTGRDCGE